MMIEQNHKSIAEKSEIKTIFVLKWVLYSVFEVLYSVSRVFQGCEKDLVGPFSRPIVNFWGVGIKLARGFLSESTIE